MSELMRFRLARSPQRILSDRTSLVNIDRQRPPNVEPADTSGAAHVYEFLTALQTVRPGPVAQQFVNDANAFVGLNTPILEQIASLDRYLATAGSQATAKAAMEAVGQKPDDLLRWPQYWFDRLRVGDSIAAAIVTDVPFEVRSRLSRLMLLFGLVELLAEAPGRVQTAADLEWALTSRTLVLPPFLLNFGIALQRAHLVRRIGFADLYVLRDEWVKYLPAEVSHIENILAGEVKESTLTRLTETQTITTTETQSAQINVQDAQTTTRFEMHDAATQDMSLAAHIDGKIETSGQYGPTKVDTHLGGSLDYAFHQSQSHAVNQSRETVARAVTSVEEKVTNIRTTMNLLRVREFDKHAFDNSGAGKQNVVGIYRWVDKVQRVQLFRFPHRMLLEFEIPEPGAYVRWLTKHPNMEGIQAENPPLLTLDGTAGTRQLVTSDMHPGGPAYMGEDYVTIGARYHALGLKPPPTTLRIGVGMSRDSANDPENDKQRGRFETNSTLPVPAGYRAVSWSASGSCYPNTFVNQIASLSITVGSGTPSQVLIDPPNNGGDFSTAGSVGNITTGNVPVGLRTLEALGYDLNVVVQCEPMAEAYQQWEADTFDLIQNAYYAMKQQYDSEVAARRLQEGKDFGNSPTQNKQTTIAELKKHTLSMLTGANFAGRNAIRTGVDRGDDGPPEWDVGAADRVGIEVQFLEQAFEWENLTYILYPYYWADNSRWPELATLQGADPEFARFLQAGSARLIVPARPGFEAEVQLYAAFGVLWGGGSPPAPGEEGYLSIAEEIKAQQQPAADGIRGQSWEVKLPTTLVWLDTQSTLPTNPGTTLDPPPGQPGV